MAESEQKKIKTKDALKMAFTDRQVLAMLILGLASGLPYVVVGGALNAWLTTVGVKPVAIGLLSWALLAYSFKFMWAAAFQSRRTPFKLDIGPRRFWMTVFLILISIGLFVLAFSNPPANLARIGLVSVIVAVFSASFDIVQSAWRIESARDDSHLDILSAVEQFGYRTASLLGGFVALILADKIGWQVTFTLAASLMVCCSLGILLASPSPVAIRHDEELTTNIRQGKYLSHSMRSIATVLTLLGWAVAFYMIAKFMHGALIDPESYSPRNFIRYQGPVVVLLTVVWLGVVSSFLVFRDNSIAKSASSHSDSQANPGVLSILYLAILEPMMELIGRKKWAILLIVALVLSYRFTDLIWGGFAYPFYLGENYGALGHTLTEVGFASKLMGVIATIIGIAIGGIAMLRFGRMPVLLVGAILAALTNLLFADLAMDANFTDSVLGFLQLDHLFANFGLDQRMARLTTVIAAENIAVGLASAASVAYLSSIVHKEYAAVQYALLVSLVMLLGVLGRPAIGAIIEEQGFAKAFILCAWLGGIAVILAAVEWIRQSMFEQPESKLTKEQDVFE